jgi:RimJ/RimL family protein N-acetyltransferase
MEYILRTERLALRRFSNEDTQFIIELLNSPGWLEYIGDKDVRTPVHALNYLQNGPIKSYQENGYGLCLVELVQGNVPIGMCGLVRRDYLDCPDIGFAFLPAFGGKGYAYEIALATLSYASDVLALEQVAAITTPRNERSIRLLEKCGLLFCGKFFLPGTTTELLLYKTTGE